ncbi:VCBS repeat-containing protein [candidate division KSB1 bacterium]|nr:VCBS repeat-containing protein [candidate division KSB1 bacterium]
MSIQRCGNFILFGAFILLACDARVAHNFDRIKYNNPDLVVDLGVGLWAWPLPMDYDGDGDNDLLVSCPDKPYNGIYFFENIQGDVAMPVFKPGVRIGDAFRNLMPSYVEAQVTLLVPGGELVDISAGQVTPIYPREVIHAPDSRVRANQWRYFDFEGDGDLDLLVGVGDWSDYGWDDAFDATGKWTNGPLHGTVYLIRNHGSTEHPDYGELVMLKAGGTPIDVYGMPSPNMADFDGDGDLDLICGEFLDKFTWFENVGHRSEPRFAEGVFLRHNGDPIHMDLQMIVPVAVDWDKDGDIDLIVGQEDGRVAFMENTGHTVDGQPHFVSPRFFRQYADDVKFGALVTPFSFDWDGDGDDDLICGNTAGYIGFIENLDDGNPPHWAEPVYLHAEGKPVRIMAGVNGSIQGPCEAKWGYTTLSVADWDQDDLPDIIVNSIWGRVMWYRNIGSRQQPELAAAQSVHVAWPAQPPKPAWVWWEPEDHELVTQWRTTPFVIDWNRDGLNDLIMLDHEGYLAFFERSRQGGELILSPGQRIFYDENGDPFHLNSGRAGKSGRRKFCIVDWDLDGRRDLLLNSTNIDFYKNIGETGDSAWFQNMGRLHDRVLAGHTSSPTSVDWNKNDIPDLLVGAEDGFLYYLENPHAPSDPVVGETSVKIIAHRGASSIAPENTLAAFEKAVEIGANYFELDVHLSADDSLMVIHDETVDKTSNGRGRVDSLPCSHLEFLDAGSWFAPGWAGEKIPTLRRALLFAKEHPIKVCIEIKAQKPGIVDTILTLIKKLDMDDQVIIFSFDFAQIAESKKSRPDIPVLFLVDEMRQTAVDSARAIGADAVGAGSAISRELAKYTHKKGLQLWAWTVNDYGEMLQLLHWQVDGLITDYPQRVAVLKKKNKLQDSKK